MGIEPTVVDDDDDDESVCLQHVVFCGEKFNHFSHYTSLILMIDYVSVVFTKYLGSPCSITAKT